MLNGLGSFAGYYRFKTQLNGTKCNLSLLNICLLIKKKVIRKNGPSNGKEITEFEKIQIVESDVDKMCVNICIII